MKVLITGGSGNIGKALSFYLSNKGFKVSWLSRKVNPSNPYKTYKWDLKNQFIDPLSISEADVIIHLAGSGVIDKSWSKKYKSEIISSRVDGLKLIKQEIVNQQKSAIHLITASGINYYGGHSSKDIMNETSPSTSHFISKVCQVWESTAFEIQPFVKTVSVLRIGVVLGENMPAQEKMMIPIKLGLGSKLGSGEQNIACIHIEDLCQLFEFIISNNLSGIYNAVGENISQWQLTKRMAKDSKRPLFAPPVPGFILRIFLGDRADLILNGYVVSNEKIISKGFRFENPNSL